MKNAGIASMITVSEETRRMQDMMKMYNMGGMDMGMFGGMGETLVLHGAVLREETNCKWLKDCIKLCKKGV